MQWIEAKVTFSDDHQTLVVDLIADAFYSLNAKGVVIDDPLLEPVESWAPDAVTRPVKPAVTGYLPADDQLESRRHYLEQRLARLAGEHGFAYSIHYQAIDEEDWAESWKAFFWPQKITPRLVVKPTWRDYQPEPGQQVIEIDPGMAFGTGTHPTTALCVQLLEKYLQAGQSVLDVGTGSGILLIAAAKLGASQLTGIDLDPMAVTVARQNLVQNRIESNCFELAEVVIDLLDDVCQVIKPGGVFICSGIIEAYRSGVGAKMASRGFDIIDVQQDGDWVALVGRLSSSGETS
jgi:ribosomal protein L11 methyltransferase